MFLFDMTTIFLSVPIFQGPPGMQGVTGYPGQRGPKVTNQFYYNL